MAVLPANILQGNVPDFQARIKGQQALITDLRKEAEIYKNLLAWNLK